MGSLDSLYSEIKWESLQKRRNDHKLSLLFKMKNNLTPEYLSSLRPQNVGNTSRYSLRNSDNLQGIFSRTALYSNFFLSSTIRTWNNLPAEVRQLDSLDTFKQFLSRERERVPKFFYSGNRRGQLLHTRIRTNCSNLNNDLFLKNITDSLCVFVKTSQMPVIISLYVPCMYTNALHCSTVFRSIVMIKH